MFVLVFLFLSTGKLMYGVTEEGDIDGKILVIPDIFCNTKEKQLSKYFCGQSRLLELSKMT